MKMVLMIAYVFTLAIFGILFICVATLGYFTQIILQYPVLVIFTSGVIFYVMAFLFAYVFLNNSRLYSWSYLILFMAAYSAIVAGLFVSFTPPLLKMNASRVRFHPTENCNTIEDPQKYLCFILGKKFYTTFEKRCDGIVSNATSFYIISLWIPPKESVCKTGLYRVSSCMLEITRLLPFDYCTTGYVGSQYVSLPQNTAKLLHDDMAN